MKKFLSLCLASLMILASASTVLADDVIVVDVSEPIAVAETTAIADEIVIDDVNAPKTAPIYTGRTYGWTNPWFKVPEQVTIKVEAGENGSVSVPAKFYAAVNSSRTFDITPDEGYEVADIVVNGVSYGPAYSVKLKNIQVAMDIKVTFEEEGRKEAGRGFSYVEDFDAETTVWANGGTTEAAVLADGALAVTSTGGDPNINAKGLNIDTNAIDIINVKFANNTASTSFQIFFTTDTTPNFCEEASFRVEVVADGNNNVFINVADYANELWTGNLVDMRIDLSNGEGSYTVDHIRFIDILYADEIAE